MSARGWRHLAVSVLALVVLPASWSAAQGNTAAGARPAGAPHTFVVGTVTDSLGYLGPLAGATVFSPDGVTAVTDSAGHFRLGPLNAGKTVIAFAHPRLDSIGFFAVPREFDIPRADSFVVALTTPSREVVYGAMCDTLTESPAGIVTGRVFYSESGNPASLGEVVAYWTEWAVGPDEAVKLEQSRRTPIREDGTYRLCNVPTNVQLVLQVVVGTRLGLEMPVSHGDRLIVLQDLSIGLSVP
jgi:hypothetical protein